MTQKGFRQFAEVHRHDAQYNRGLISLRKFCADPAHPVAGLGSSYLSFYFIPCAAISYEIFQLLPVL